MVQEDKGGITCRGLGKDLDICPEGKIPSLNPDNREVWGLFKLMFPGLVWREGYDYMAIKLVLDTWERETGKQSSMEMLGQIVALVEAIDAERRSREK